MLDIILIIHILRHLVWSLCSLAFADTLKYSFPKQVQSCVYLNEHLFFMFPTKCGKIQIKNLRKDLCLWESLEFCIPC